MQDSQWGNRPCEEGECVECHCDWGAIHSQLVWEDVLCGAWRVQKLHKFYLSSSANSGCDWRINCASVFRSLWCTDLNHYRQPDTDGLWGIFHILHVKNIIKDSCLTLFRNFLTRWLTLVAIVSPSIAVSSLHQWGSRILQSTGRRIYRSLTTWVQGSSQGIISHKTVLLKNGKKVLLKEIWIDRYI